MFFVINDFNYILIKGSKEYLAKKKSIKNHIENKKPN